MTKKIQNIDELIALFNKGEKHALARLITLVENDPLLGRKIFRNFDDLLEKSYVIGVTGPPGVGKSTLVDLLVMKIINQGKKVGVISVDPTSPYSGGAFLGDRVRLKHIATHSSLFMRSMGSRGSSGGLSRAVFDVSLLYEAFGIDIIIIETVGAGQSEVDIRNIAYTTLVLSVPGLGDQIQAQKAGIIEIADIQVVNKKDLPGADAVGVELDMMLDYVFNNAVDPFWRPPVLLTDSTKDDGVNELLEGIWKHKEYLESNGFLVEKKKDKIRKKLREIIYTEIENFIQKEILHESELESLTNLIEQKESGLYEAAYNILNGYLDKLRCLDLDS